jgi:murein DD-endopeptidase MepM/ murein hydrolase activator NlpD
MKRIHLLIATASLATVACVTAKAAWPPEPLVEISVPFAPTAFPGRGGRYLVYELRITNLSKESVSLRRLEILDAANRAEPLASYEGAAFENLLQHFANPAVGERMPTAGERYLQLTAGETAMVFLTLASKPDATVAPALVHRVVMADSSVEGAPASTSATKLLVLGAPLEGGPWRAYSGAASNVSHHRRQFCVFGGRMNLDSRYAIDWKRIENGANFHGNESDIRAYFSYESRVLAVANGKVVAVRDGIPDNKPGHVGAEALNLSFENIMGNAVVLELGSGQFAYYGHLRPGSLRVKPGDRVKRGQVIARVGNSGSSFEPHLHFEVTNSPEWLRGEGLPYLIDQFSDLTDGDASPQRRELPIADSVVEFQPSRPSRR